MILGFFGAVLFSSPEMSVAVFLISVKQPYTDNLLPLINELYDSGCVDQVITLTAG